MLENRENELEALQTVVQELEKQLEVKENAITSINNSEKNEKDHETELERMSEIILELENKVEVYENQVKSNDFTIKQLENSVKSLENSIKSSKSHETPLQNNENEFLRPSHSPLQIKEIEEMRKTMENYKRQLLDLKEIQGKFALEREELYEEKIRHLQMKSKINPFR